MTGRAATIFFVILMSVTGCSKVFSSEFPHVWVASSTASAFMVQITRQTSNLSGTADWASIEGSDPTKVVPTHAAFTGTIDGAAITLTFPSGFGFVTNMSGTLTDSTMTLQVPQSDGSMAQVILTPDSVETYNNHVADIRKSAAANASAKEAAMVAASNADALQRTQQQIDNLAGTLVGDIAVIQARLAKPLSLANFEKHMTAATAHLESTKAFARKADAESDPFTACSDAYDSQSAAYDVHSDAYDINSDVSDVDTRIADVNNAVSQLNQDLPSYTQAAKTLPSYTPQNAPDTGKVQTLVSEASKQTGAWKTTGQGYQGRVAQLVTQANTIAAQAKKAHCRG